MDLDAAFPKDSKSVEYKFNVKILTPVGFVNTVHCLREPTGQENLDFRRATSTSRWRNGKLVTTDVALRAPLELYDRICVRVLAENGAGPQELDDFKSRISDDVKAQVIAAYQNRIEIDDGEMLGN